MFSDIFTLIDFLKYQKKIKRVFFFESSFIENHLAPYVDKNKNIDETIIISLYKTQNNNLKKFKIFQVNKLFFLNLFFLLLKTKYCYSSTPDIDHSAFQRSVFKKTKYIYIQHSPVGLIKIFRDNALTNFDVVQVVNTFQKNDLINISKRKNKKIKAWQGKYLFLGDENNEKFSFNINKQERKKILIAPTWGTDFFNLNIHLTIKKNLNPSEYDIFIRPHNMSILNNKNLISDLIQNNFTMDSHIGLVTNMLLGVSILFELPVLVFFLTKIGLITPAFLKKYRKHALVVVLIVAAIITPPDVASQIIVAIPIVILYEVSIKVSKIVIKKQQKNAHKSKRV